MSKLFSKFHSALLEILTPTTRCLVCGADVFDGSGFCPSCTKSVTFNNGKTCKCCGVALHGAEDYCGHCAHEKTWFNRAYSCFVYCGGVQKAILALKFAGYSTNAKVLARYLADFVRQNNIVFDVVTFVPMTKIALKRRGYNQSQLLAEAFCDILGADAPESLLKKVKETIPQEKLNLRERRENLKNVFVATSNLQGKSVLIIDDIKTSGSTLNECAKVLKKNGAARVECLTVASREEQMQVEQSQPFSFGGTV